MKVVNKFMPIDLKNDKIFVDYFNRFKLLIKNNDRLGLAQFMKVSYPNLHISFDKIGGKKGEQTYHTVRTERDFVNFYPKLFDSRMRKLIAKQEVKDLQLMVDGIMLARGQVWWKYYYKDKRILTSSIANQNIIFN